MAKSTGVILVIGAITVGNQVIVHKGPLDWKVPIATGFAAGIFALGEKVSEPIVVGLAYIALVAVLFTRLDPRIPAPVESFVTWYEGGKKT